MAVSPGVKKSLRDRDQGRCRYCGDEADNIDHVVPSSRGGDDRVGNLVQSCARCNHYKRDRTPEEAGMVVLKPATAHTYEQAALIRASQPALAQRPNYGFSNVKRKRNLLLLQQAVEAAADPDNLHYPYNPHRPTPRRTTL